MMGLSLAGQLSLLEAGDLQFAGWRLAGRNPVQPASGVALLLGTDKRHDCFRVQLGTHDGMTERNIERAYERVPAVIEQLLKRNDQIDARTLPESKRKGSMLQHAYRREDHIYGSYWSGR